MNLYFKKKTLTWLIDSNVFVFFKFVIGTKIEVKFA